jgi:benzoyl-CoA reductase/2-hydroxyglutaryl-CoA dehydratase subunit BcrC/BadD/HgdB
MNQDANKAAGLHFFNTFSEHSLAALEAAREAGKPVAGVYCIYAPLEVIRAAGAVPIGLCGKRQAPIQAAEEVLPAGLCPLIKSSYGYAKTDTCPFFSASDFVIAETTCDGKKKMYEFLGRIKPLHLMHLPYDPSLPGSLQFWLDEVGRLCRFLASQGGNELTETRLLEEITVQNAIRDLLWDIVRVNADGAPILTGMQLLPVLESKSFMVESGAVPGRPSKSARRARGHARTRQGRSPGAPSQNPADRHARGQGVPQGAAAHRGERGRGGLPGQLQRDQGA